MLTDDKNKLTQEQAQAELNNLRAEYDQLEARMVDIALEYNLSLDLDGRSLITTQEDADYWDRQVGDWLYSSETC